MDARCLLIGKIISENETFKTEYKEENTCESDLTVLN